MNTLISIVTVCFNAEKYILRTIDSVSSLKYDNIEYIIVDGGSNDSTNDIIKHNYNIISKNVKSVIYISEKDNGIYDAMNKGANLASGEWIFYLNAGDTFVDLFILEKLSQFFNDKSLDVVYGDVIQQFNGYERYVYAKDVKLIKHKMPFCHQSVFVKTRLVKEKKFNLTYRIAADYDLFYRIYNEGAVFMQVQCPISNYEACDGLAINNPLNVLKEYMKANGSFYKYKFPVNYYLKSILLYFRCVLRDISPTIIVKYLRVNLLK